MNMYIYLSNYINVIVNYFNIIEYYSIRAILELERG